MGAASSSKLPAGAVAQLLLAVLQDSEDNKVRQAPETWGLEGQRQPQGSAPVPREAASQRIAPRTATHYYNPAHERPATIAEGFGSVSCCASYSVTPPHEPTPRTARRRPASRPLRPACAPACTSACCARCMRVRGATRRSRQRCGMRGRPRRCRCVPDRYPPPAAKKTALHAHTSMHAHILPLGFVTNTNTPLPSGLVSRRKAKSALGPLALSTGFGGGQGHPSG